MVVDGGFGVGGVDVAVDDEVAEDGRGAADRKGEGCHELFVGRAFRGAVVEGQRVVLAVEGAGEPMLSVARHAADFDACPKIDGLVEEGLAAFK